MKKFVAHISIVIIVFVWSFLLMTEILDYWQHRIDNPVVRDRELEKWKHEFIISTFRKATDHPLIFEWETITRSYWIKR